MNFQVSTFNYNLRGAREGLIEILDHDDKAIASQEIERQVLQICLSYDEKVKVFNDKLLSQNDQLVNAL